MKRVSLRTKGLLFVALITLIPLLLAGIIGCITSRNSMLNSYMEQASSNLTASAGNMSSWMAIRRAEVLVMSHNNTMLQGTDTSKLDYFKEQLKHFGTVYNSIGYIAPDGSAVSTGGLSRSLQNWLYINRSKLSSSMPAEPLVPVLDGEQQIFIMAPVLREDGQSQGFVYASILLSSLESFFESPVHGTSKTRLYNDKGDLLYGDKEEAAGADGDVWGSFDSSQLDQYLGMQEMNTDGKRHIFFYSKVSNTSWYLVSDVSLSQLASKLVPVYAGIAVSIGLAELIILGLCFLYFTRIINRLNKILGVTEQAAARSFETEHLSELPDDEIGQLAGSVNSMKAQLSEMFDQLEAVINQNQYAFIILNEQFRIVGLNAAAEELLGYKLEELKGHATPLVFMDEREIRLMAEQLSADLGQEIQPGLQVLKEIQLLQSPVQREWTFISKDGTRTPVVHTSNPLRDPKGRITGYVGMAYNVSEKNQVERTRNRLLNIVESARDLIASVDRHGRIVYINGAGQTILGLDGNSDYRMKTFLSREMFADLVAGAQTACEEGYWEGEVELLALNGEIIPVSMVVVVHLDDKTGEFYFSCIARDINEQRSVQEELLRAKQEAEDANQAKSRFLALMSHEIRTPLNGIIGLSQLIRKTGLSETQKEYIDKIGISSDTLLRLVNDILDFSKIEAGRSDIERFAFRMDELLNQLAGQLSVFLGGKENFEFMIMTPPDMPKTMMGDPLRLEQILLNICMNAIKFTEQGRVKLQLSIMQLSQDTATIRFVVEDTGIGMTKEQLSRLFKPFTQGDSSTTRKYGGTGLGLFIATHFLEMMESKLKVESEAGVGSKFHFSLHFPVVGGVSAPVYALRGKLAEKPVWVLENDPQMSELLCGWLESFGLVTVPFTSWKGAKERLSRVGAGALPGFVLLDMEMEDMYGMETWIEFQRKAREEGVPTVVMTTSYGRDELLQLPEADRPSTLLTKPLTRLALFRSLSGLLERKEEPKELPSLPESLAEHQDLNHPQIRILLAEDNKINQLVSVESLKGYGFMVGIAENGKEVLEKLETEEWHLVLMDIHMPVMDGEEAVGRIRQNPKFRKLPVIALTANGLKADHERYIKLGMDDVITKPVDARVLYETVARWLGKAAGKTEPEHAAREEETRKAKPAVPEPEAEPLRHVRGIDMAALVARVGGKRGIADHMLQRFMADYGSFCDGLVQDLERGDMLSAKRRAHTLKGVASNLSAGRIMSLATTLDKMLQRPRVKREEWILPVELLGKELSALIKSIEEAYDS